MSQPRVRSAAQDMQQGRLPDFIIIGAMKSATSTLYDQLAKQPGIFMSDPKEPNFFSDEEQFRKGLAWYTGLFSRASAGDLLGEASTHYAKLPTHPHAVRRLREHVPNARLVYVMRHPVDRLVSHYVHEWSKGNIDCGIDAAAKRHPEMIDYGRYSMQLEPYFEAFGRSAVLPVFFDRVIREPARELERVCRFIGYGRVPQLSNDLPPSNVSSTLVRKFPLYGLLIDSAPATWLRRAFVPKGWRDWVRTRLTMRQRPVLSDPVRAALEARFDPDLERLGQWLGTSLNCRNFKQVTGAAELDWVARDA